MTRIASPGIRITAGVLAFLGVVAIAFETVQENGIQVEFLLFAKLFALVVFVYAAVFGINPLE